MENEILEEQILEEETLENEILDEEMLEIELLEDAGIVFGSLLTGMWSLEHVSEWTQKFAAGI